MILMTIQLKLIYLSYGEKRNDLSSCLKMLKDRWLRSDVGSWFQSVGAALEKALLPRVGSILGEGCLSRMPLEDRRE